MSKPWWSSFAVASEPVLQVAVDGQWENAYVAPRAGDAARALEMVDEIPGTAKHVAVEVMWPGYAFVGTGWLIEERERAATAIDRAFAADALSSIEAELLALVGEAPESRGAVC